MHPTLKSLFPGPVITDGAWGTQLQLMGLPVGQCAELWNLEHPDRVERVGRAYVEAGSQVILTNSLGANRVQLTRRGLGDRTVEISRAVL
jgi:5-methyltetrahydrofolate--homocysteine methyltransferase